MLADPILRREDEKHKRYDARLATIGPGLKLLAFGLNHVGVLGDDAKKVIAEQATVLARQGSYSLGTAKRILRTHISIALHSFNALSVNVRKRPSLSSEPYSWTIRQVESIDQGRIGRTVRIRYE